MSDLVKIARTYVPFQTTHFDGCEREHIECLVQRMADEIERLTAENLHLRQSATVSVSSTLHDAALAELNGEIERLTAERDALGLDCAGLQTSLSRVAAERDEHARWRQKLADDLHERESKIIELRRQLAEAGKSIARQAATIRGLTRPAEE